MAGGGSSQERTAAVDDFEEADEGGGGGRAVVAAGSSVGAAMASCPKLPQPAELCLRWVYRGRDVSKFRRELRSASDQSESLEADA